MKISAKHIGEQVKAVRKSLGVTQKVLAMTSGTGLRFIIELEKGKPTCQVGKVLTVLNTLGIDVKLSPPAPEPRRDHPVTLGVVKAIQTRCESTSQMFLR